MADATSIFITADIDDRVRRVAERLGVDDDTARKIIGKKESNRSAFYNYYTGKRWGAAESYDLCVNTSRLGIEGTVEYIAEFIKKRMGE